MKDRGKIKVFIKKLTIELYYPYAYWNKVNIGANMNTVVVIYRKSKDRAWVMDWSFAIKIIGFGIGFAYNHCENPNSPNYFG